MKTLLMLIGLLFSLSAFGRGETAEMTAGPNLAVSYDPDVWKPLAPLRPPEPGAFQSMVWELQPKGEVQITVASHPEQMTETQYKRAVFDTQKFRGDPADLVRELRQSIAGRDWLVLEFRNAKTRPARSETHYFSPAADGHITFFVIGDEAVLPKHREVIEAFLSQVQVK